MKRNIIAALLSGIITAMFLYAVLIPPSAFNFIPFALHQAFFQNSVEEASFIRVFDVIIGIILFWLLYKFFSFAIKSFTKT
jgi:hypothetical protein